jgi:hypothetical protein
MKRSLVNALEGQRVPLLDDRAVMEEKMLSVAGRPRRRGGASGLALLDWQFLSRRNIKIRSDGLPVDMIQRAQAGPLQAKPRRVQQAGS